MLLILFGLSGAGKNFVGEILAKEFGYYFWDADKDIPENIQTQIQKKELFTQDMRDELTEIMINRISNLRDQHPNLVLSQALYKKKNREKIALLYPEAQFIWITATQENIQRRLRQRNDRIDPDYAEKMCFHFEIPEKADPMIINDSDTAAVITQLHAFLK